MCLCFYLSTILNSAFHHIGLGQSGFLQLVFDLLVAFQTNFQKKVKNIGIKLDHEQLQIRSQETIKKVLKRYALAADRTHIPIIVETALCNTM